MKYSMIMNHSFPDLKHKPMTCNSGYLNLVKSIFFFTGIPPYKNCDPPQKCYEESEIDDSMYSKSLNPMKYIIL
jgi:hypothetical protein